MSDAGDLWATRRGRRTTDLDVHHASGPDLVEADVEPVRFRAVRGAACLLQPFRWAVEVRSQFRPITVLQRGADGRQY